MRRRACDGEAAHVAPAALDDSVLGDGVMARAASGEGGRPRVLVTLYGKPGCHLCEQALAVVERVRAERSFELEQVDVTLDPRLLRRYGERIPVLAIAGEEAFEYVVEPNALRERLDRVSA